MPIGIGILSDLLLVAASREVLVYKQQSGHCSSPALGWLCSPIQLKGSLANKQGIKDGKLQRVELKQLHTQKFCVALGAHRNCPQINAGSPLRWDCY